MESTAVGLSHRPLKKQCPSKMEKLCQEWERGVRDSTEESSQNMETRRAGDLALMSPSH